MTKVKLCGLFRPQDISAANAVQPDYAGFVFAKSHRQINLATALKFRQQLAAQIKSVGVFVNAPIATMLAAYQSGAITIIQLHGQEDETTVQTLQQAGAKVIQVVNLQQQTYQSTRADAVMFDGGKGAGKTFAWQKIPANVKQPIFLAGGITLANVKQAITTVAPAVIDVSSGIETANVKDPVKMQQMVQLVHGNH
ncbi:phosphoribosylanthranilate isomerase [Loigolactobacillus backii]|uniref:N-(5'-phosphoribosyl)anthranilate isomerase n=1 Tax=Loigolactobacillus backii TaxID=375175 RepID=A0A192GZK8_9LACO|nr:phosphoribosylanthranilate isomerase [Loigolactobacillus backii]ANK58812.1 hypothetical protein AYR52_00165 [Loigolactobacillus backii]ANK61525.1 hypothetical protein AYR53_01345 [Loigolactobacillus backii]ANK63802.1 hypothetical protein AYR54_00160 [Loigolactobacillus backii]ANK66250.1 hypothetical protein AYR55_00160 [Loigolactobacillus backii]ANK69277.1 hypothetical protein AYR56_03370 [Loigolactobacillus backii]